MKDTLARQANDSKDPDSGVRKRLQCDEEQEGLLILRRNDRHFRELVPRQLQHYCTYPSTVLALGVNVHGDVVLHWQSSHARSKTSITRKQGFAYIVHMQRQKGRGDKPLFVEAEYFLHDNRAVRDSLLRCAHGLLGNRRNPQNHQSFVYPPPTERSVILVVSRSDVRSVLVGGEQEQLVTDLRFNRVTGGAIIVLDGRLMYLPPPNDRGMFDLRLASPISRS
jgi:hypothetical protein